MSIQIPQVMIAHDELFKAVVRFVTLRENVTATELERQSAEAAYTLAEENCAAMTATIPGADAVWKTVTIYALNHTELAKPNKVHLIPSEMRKSRDATQVSLLNLRNGLDIDSAEARARRARS